MRKLLPSLALLGLTGCYYGPFHPSAEVPVGEVALRAWVGETQSGRIEVSAQLRSCDADPRFLDLSGSDRLVANLDGETIWLHLHDQDRPGEASHGVFPRKAKGGRLTISFRRGSSVDPDFEASVVLPARVRLISPRRYRAVEVGRERLEVRWKRRWGRNPGSLGADVLRWEIDPIREPGAPFVPSREGVFGLDRDAEGFDLEVGTLPVPELTGRDPVRNQLRMVRSNLGIADPAFCGESEIWAHREVEKRFRTRP